MKPFAKKRFGQNFLIDPNILRKIARSIAPREQDIIVEIGPGKGALTKFLADSRATVHAVEIDGDLIPDLEAQFSDYENVKIHHRDTLTMDYSALAEKAGRLRIVGNIPYNITSPLLFTMFANAAVIKDIHFLVQREIARRICAMPNSKEYGILSVITRFYGTPQIDFDVSPNVFRPIPEVHSSMLAIPLKNAAFNDEFKAGFHRTVRTAFSKRRKTLKNTLTELLPADPGNCPIDLSRRAESLSVAEFITLTQWLFRKK